MIVESEMISPQGYIRQRKDQPLEELIKERNKLLEEIREYEEEYILNTKSPKFTGIIIDPSPSTVYFWNNRYLNEITDLIIERKKENKIKARMDKIIEKNQNTTDITAGVLGFIIGDCLGVPVEFKNRYWLKSSPVIDMLERGSHFQPKGTWSDDSSMVLATMDSLVELKSYGNNSFYDMADKFVAWYKNGLYSPNNEAFDIGNTTRKALEKFIANRNKECGEGSLYDNGNGSLMRILPLAYYFYKTNIELEQRKDITFEVSSITHSHIMSKYACLIYEEYLLNIIKGIDKYEAYQQTIETIEGLLKLEEKENKKIISEAFKRILNGKLDKLKENDIKSSGYVVDTLEAVLWIVLNSKDYKESVLEAVNLGDDTDTVGALAGGLLGAIYGYNAIPIEWVKLVIKKDEILNLCRNWEATKFNKAEDYITIDGEILIKNDISKYILLYETLEKYKDYHKNIDLTDSKKVNDYAFQIIKDLFEIKILCQNYKDITKVTPYKLKESDNKKEEINKLNVLECLSLITLIQRESYWDGGYTEIYYKYTKNEILPLLINRILYIIESIFIIDVALIYLFYYTLVIKGEEASLKDSLEILEIDEIRNPKVLFNEDTEARKYYNDFQELTDSEYIVVKAQAIEVLTKYINKPEHKDLNVIYSDDSLIELVEEITRKNEKPKLNREKLLDKLRNNKKTSENIYENILSDLKIIEEELDKCEPIENNEVVLGVRQNFVVEEFDRYILGQEKMYIENKYNQTYYDIEQFIEGAEYPADRYQNPEFRYSKYISSKEVKILMSMINRLKLECQKELDQQNNSLNNEVVLKIRRTNWGMIGPNDWTDVIWKIYKDLTVNVEKTYRRAENNIETMNKKITEKEYNNILKNIELSKENNVVVTACDGSAWEIIQYEKGQEVWKRDLGYIYGIKPLESIAKIVMKLFL